jgi:galactokinase
MHTYAPGRAELLGNHTDYNEGLVLSLAISRGTMIEGRKRDDGRVVLRSKDLGKEWSGRPGDPAPAGDDSWAAYAFGVYEILREHGAKLGGAELEIATTIPIGAGLSSSAALEVGTAVALRKLYPFDLADMDLVKVAQAAEHRYAGVKCGLLDQISVYFSKASQATHIDCRTLQVSHLPLPKDGTFLIVHSGVKHALTAGEYNERRASCEEATRLLGKKALRDLTGGELEARAGELPLRALMRARHVVGENERVAHAVSCLAQNNLEAFGKLMFASHDSSVRNFENSCEELDFLVAFGQSHDACLGARLSGGGFGGATIQLVKPGSAAAYGEALSRAYEAKYGQKPLVLETTACDGAR